MKKLYEKSELRFAIIWIVIYCVLQSIANSLNEAIGVEYSASAVGGVIQAVILFFFIRKNSLSERYGLCKSSVPARQLLYYVPLIILATGNLWYSVTLNNYSPTGTVCRVVCMLCVGFIEEVIFRGFLFKAMAKNNLKSAIIVSSVTFGIGHIINLFNGSGMELADNILQIIFAVAVGFLFVTILYRSGSLIPCIIAHSANNSLSTFSNEAGLTMEKQMVHVLVMIVIAVAYTLILTKTFPKNQPDNRSLRSSEKGE